MSHPEVRYPEGKGAIALGVPGETCCVCNCQEHENKYLSEVLENGISCRDQSLPLTLLGPEKQEPTGGTGHLSPNGRA